MQQREQEEEDLGVITTEAEVTMKQEEVRKEEVRVEEVKKKAEKKQTMSEEQRGDKIVALLEFWFGEVNLRIDSYLRSRIEERPDGYVALETLCRFPKLRSMKASVPSLQAALRSQAGLTSAVIELSRDGLSVRRKLSMPVALPPGATTVVAGPISVSIKRKQIKQMFAKFGHVVRCSLFVPRPGKKSLASSLSTGEKPTTTTTPQASTVPTVQITFCDYADEEAAHRGVLGMVKECQLKWAMMKADWDKCKHKKGLPSTKAIAKAAAKSSRVSSMMDGSKDKQSKGKHEWTQEEKQCLCIAGPFPVTAKREEVSNVLRPFGAVRKVDMKNMKLSSFLSKSVASKQKLGMADKTQVDLHLRFVSVEGAKAAVEAATQGKVVFDKTPVSVRMLSEEEQTKYIGVIERSAEKKEELGTDNQAMKRRDIRNVNQQKNKAKGLWALEMSQKDVSMKPKATPNNNNNNNKNKKKRATPAIPPARPDPKTEGPAVTKKKRIN